MHARLKVWGGDNIGTQFIDLETRPCTHDDFNGNETSLFYPVYESHKSSFEYYLNKLQCISQDYELYGDFNSGSASHLVIQFEKCAGENCKSESEITTFLRRKFILTMQNGQSFNNDDYTHSKIQKSSKAVWYMVNSQYRSEYINELQVTQLDLQDSIHLGELH